jgi:hypothetical protein
MIMVMSGCNEQTTDCDDLKVDCNYTDSVDNSTTVPSNFNNVELKLEN